MTNINDILRIRTNDVKPVKGSILISEPFLMDYYFKRSVVLLAEHNEEGTFGLILNKPIDVRFTGLIKDFPAFNASLHLGGPVKTDSLFFIHTLGEQVDESAPIKDGLYWGGNLNTVKELMLLDKIRPDQIRFFVGYSGWVHKQLEGELQRNSWVVSNLSVEQIMKSDNADLWTDSLLELGGEYAYWVNFPDDPGMN
jgi:putative transcriptional regulator